ncbi:MAG: HAMP domain-containing protein [Candidatus Omnitrophica bacterium]|nr:HAMP domain-containing protein [Candidatus Omnitrophota bacterium]
MAFRLQHKITVTFVALFSAILLVTFLYLDRRLREDYYARTRRDILKDTRLIETFLLEKDMGEMSPHELDFLADRINRDLGLRVTIIALDGTVLGDSDLTTGEVKEVENHFGRPEVQEALLSGTGMSKRFSTTVRKHMLYVAQIVGKGSPQGIVRLAIPLSGLEETSADLKRVLFAAVAAAFFLSLLASSIASKVISKRLQEMAQIAKKIAKGDLSEKMTVSSGDETADLAEAFNYMIEQIKARIKDITTGKSRFEAVLLSMFDGVIVIDSKGTIILMNPSLAQLLQVMDDPSGKKPVEVLRNIDIQEILDEVLSRKEGVEAREVSVLMPEPKTLMVHATPVVREGKTIGAVLVFHDITELRNLESIRRDFVANVSHELRTPIANIKGYAETLLDGALQDKENSREFVGVIYEEADRLAKLIADILSLSGIESGKLDMNPERASIKEIAERAMQGLKRKAEDKEINARVMIGEDLPQVFVDTERITQVLFNLIENAVKYTYPGGKIKVTAREDGGYVCVEVEDNGIGIPEEDQPRIFERFYRVDKARSREMGGTGLGLSIVKHIVQEHGGEVRVESSPGKGTTFFFTIPKA